MDDRHGAKQPHRFDPARAAALDDDAREAWLPAEDLFALLDAPEHARVLDFGAGTGHLTFNKSRCSNVCASESRS
jgi:trans-aconitate methyltransferase